MASDWHIEHFKRKNGEIPGLAFRFDVPVSVAARIKATLDAVRDNTPPRWKSPVQFVPMKDQSSSGGVDMSDFHEVRDEHDGTLYRLFCIVERDAPGLSGPSIVVIDGRAKPQRTGFSNEVYEEVRKLGKEYLAGTPRAVATVHDAEAIMRQRIEAAQVGARPARKAGKNKKKGKP